MFYETPHSTDDNQFDRIPAAEAGLDILADLPVRGWETFPTAMPSSILILLHLVSIKIGRMTTQWLRGFSACAQGSGICQTREKCAWMSSKSQQQRSR